MNASFAGQPSSIPSVSATYVSASPMTLPPTSTFNSTTDLLGTIGLADSSLHQGDDPNSPEVFRQNVQLIQHHITRLQDLAQRALLGISNAYQPGRNPLQAEADLATLKQELHIVLEMLRVSGVGALPLLPTPPADASTPAVSGAPSAATANTSANALMQEPRLLEDTRRRVQAVYEQQRSMHTAAEVVANLLTQVPPPGAGHASTQLQPNSTGGPGPRRAG